LLPSLVYIGIGVVIVYGLTSSTEKIQWKRLTDR
jgi:hypothetical protein